jgi:thiol:disulfide interchange protein DsbC
MKFRTPGSVLRAVTLVCASVFSLAVYAADAVDEAVVSKLRVAMEKSSTGLAIESVSHSEIPGLLAVQFANGPLVYASSDGAHFVVGDMFRVEAEGFVNLADQRRDGERKAKIDGLDPSDMIVFSPAGEPRGVVTVFTDVTCFYCQKLHKEVPELNKRGVEVRYLAYPRAGLSSPGFRQLASAWCADDPQATLTKLKNKESVPENVCADNPIASQYQLGQALGVRGTPAMITDTGKMIPGYQSADELMVTLGLE